MEYNVNDLVLTNEGKMGIVKRLYIETCWLQRRYCIQSLDSSEYKELYSSSILGLVINDPLSIIKENRRFRCDEYVRITKNVRAGYGAKIRMHKDNKDIFKIKSVNCIRGDWSREPIYELEGLEGLWFLESYLTKSRITQAMIYQKNKEKDSTYLFEDFLNSKVDVVINNEAEFEEFVLFLQQRGMSEIIHAEQGGFNYRAWQCKTNRNCPLRLTYDVNNHCVKQHYTNTSNYVSVSKLIK